VPDRVTVSDGVEEISFTARELAVEPDLEATVRNAYAVGREGNILGRVGARARGLFGRVEVPMAVSSYDEDLVASRVREMAREVASEPRPAQVSISDDGREVEVTAPREGYEADVEATVRNVEEAIGDLSGQAELAGRPLEAPGLPDGELEKAEEQARAATEAPAVLRGGGKEWELAPSQLARVVKFVPEGDGLRFTLDREALRSELKGLFSELNTKARDARFEFKDGEFRVVPSRVGYELDERRMFEDLESGLAEGRREYELPVTETGRPRFTTAQAEEQRPTEKLGEYRTRYTTPGNYNAPRTENLRIAARALSGQVVAPGEVFSINDVIAPLDYKSANAFVGGRVEETAGGGLGQIASTLYMAANYAGMEVVERHSHYAMLDYIRPGLDATVWFGAANGFSGEELDMRFRNTSDSHIFIRQYLSDDDYLYAEVWGRPTGKEVTMISRPLWINERTAGWATFKTVKRDGRTLQSELMYTSTYRGIVDAEGKREPPTEVRIAPNRP